jgi:murein DD-endopeptidase MepM/ murein hydrolase activator NlpD
MKKLLSIIILALIANASLSQTETASLKKVAAEFEKNFNANDFEGIFKQFSSKMQTAVPLDRLTSYLTNLRSEAGKITKRKFVKFQNASLALYKVNFERSMLGFNLSIDGNSEINGMQFIPFKEDNLPKMERNISRLILPFKGEWTVFWGGDTKELNYHVVDQAQKNAFDLLITDEKGNSYKTIGQTNEDYYVFGKEIIAPVAGEIVLVVDGIKDNTPGEMNPIYVPGNTVIIKTVNNEYLFFAHFKQHSIKVKQGQQVKQGELLGLCGNSGNSTEPHLHFSMQNVESLNKATGVKSYFDNILVNGELKNDYSPIKGEKIKNN